MCTQLPGEVVFVPEGWAHATYNVERTPPATPSSAGAPEAPQQEQVSVVIGIGAQNTWLAEQREQFSREVLQRHASDYDALKGVATSIFHRVFPAAAAAAGSGGADALMKEASLDEAVLCLR
jgi:hypothetical protein